jgi:hypothetical protein
VEATKKPSTGTPGSSAVERGFDVRAETNPNLEVWRVAVVWTQDGWRTVNYTECRLTGSRSGTDTWTAGVSYYSSTPVTFAFAVAGGTRSEIIWANNQGWNYTI